MHRGGREGGANYLQVVIKDTLGDQVGLSIPIVRLASRGGIKLASLKEIFFLFQMQLSAKCLVIFQLTISIYVSYVTPAVSGIPTASERGGGESEVAHLWAKWLRHPCRLGDPHRFRAGGEIRSGPQVGKVATSPLPLGDPHRCRAGGGGGGSEVAHLWAKWLRHPCRLGDPHRFRAGGKIRSGPQVGKVATSPLPSRGSPPLQIFFLLSFYPVKKFFSTEVFTE